MKELGVVVGVGAELNQVECLVRTQRGAAEDRASVGPIAHRGSEIDVLRIEAVALRGVVLARGQRGVKRQFALHLKVALDLVSVLVAGREGVNRGLDDQRVIAQRRDGWEDRRLRVGIRDLITQESTADDLRGVEDG